MPRKTLTEDDYDSMILAFQKDAPLYRHYTAAQHCNVDAKTLKKAWELGYPSKKWKPIKEVIAAIQAKNKQKTLEEVTARRESAKRAQNDAEMAVAKALGQETQIATLSRGGALAILAASTSLISSARLLADTAKRQIETALSTDEAGSSKLSATQSVTLLERLASCQAKIVAMAKQSLELERLVEAKLDAIPAKKERKEELTLEEAELRLNAGLAILNQAKITPISGSLGALNEPKVGRRAKV
jgi:hypothetical protein